MTSEFLPSLQSQGFRIHRKEYFSAENQSGFYSVFAAALHLHCTKDYGELKTYFSQLWSQRFPSFYSLDYSEAPATLAAALRSDLYAQFQSKPWGDLMHRGQVPSKASVQVWTEIMDYCAVQLTWVEATSTGIATHYYAPESAGTWMLFVTVAEEQPFLHLLVHRDFEQTTRIGYPFYASVPENLNTSVSQKKNHQEAQSSKEITRTQADIINCLLSLVVHSLPAGTRTLQDQLSVLHKRSQPLSPSIDSAAFTAFLQLSEPSAPAVRDSCPPLPTNACVSCKKLWCPSTLWRADHGCALCNHCCFQQSGKPICLSCKTPLSSSDHQSLKTFETISVKKC